MKTKIKTFFFSLLCICSLLPYLFVAAGFIKIKRAGGLSNYCVILGPFVGLDGYMVDGGDTPPDYSQANLKPDTPYPNGALRAYRNLGIYNAKRDEKIGLLKYLAFARYFSVVRDDGRPIYDDDGILDVSSDIPCETDEVVDYKAHICVTCTNIPSDNGGFLWTTRQGRFKNASFQVKEWTQSKYGANLASLQHELNISVPNNPTNQLLASTSLYSDNEHTYYDSIYCSISFTGDCYWENTFWGGTGDNIGVSAGMSGGWFKISSRNWENTLTSSMQSSTYLGSTAYYSPKEFTVIATNLNNYIKINDVKATSQYGTSVVPFKDGHHITISNEGKTKVEIENGAENTYTTYYCFIDNTLPDVSYFYNNENALYSRKVGTITTDTSGAKSQTITEGIFKDQVQVNFAYDEDTESPEYATYTFNGQTYPLESGTWLSEEGDYVITVYDLAGNKTISKFTIDKSNPSYNLNRIINDKSYKIANWYLTNIPSGYKDSGSYSFATYDMALQKATTLEKQNCVNEYYLSNVEDFNFNYLLASGETVKVGDYYYYKSKDDPSLYVYYFDEQSLNNIVERYAKNYVSEKQTYKINSLLSPNNYGNTIDSSVYQNKIQSNNIEGYIINNFTFKYLNDNDTYKIYCDYQLDNVEEWKELQYDKSFALQANSSGLYKIKEVDYCGHETYYYVYLDLTPPMLDVEAKIYGKDKTISQTISPADIPKNNDLIFYYEDFKIVKVVEDDLWWTLEIKCPDNTTKRFTYLDDIPSLQSLGNGEFTITIADRVNNIFTFKVCIVGKAPEVKFENINANTQLKITIKNNENYNSIMDLKIYKNDICLNAENGYDENPDDDNNELIFISPTTLKYIFSKGGLYKVEITDNFGRTLEYEYKFEKDLPTGILIGVEHNGKTKNSVQFLFDSNKYLVVVEKNNNVFESNSTIDENITTLNFEPNNDIEDFYNIKLLDKNDIENYNIYSFTIKTIKPKLYLYGVEPNGTTGGNVYATWETNEEQYTASFTHNGKTDTYRKGQILTTQGNYTITLIDEIGNENSVNFIIDKSVNFSIIDKNGKSYEIEQIEYINFDIKIIDSEPLNITITKDDKSIEYNFGLMITNEGKYAVRLTDEFSNTIYFTFTIDKTPPQATLYGVDNYGKTNKSAWICSSESNLICWFVKDQTLTETYKLGNEITSNGKYIVYVADFAKNYISFEFEIDKEIQFDINTYNGGISNNGVRIIAYENLRITMFKDNKPIDYLFEQVLTDDGEYSFTLVDELGNKYSSFFNIITKKKQNLNHILQENISVKNIKKDDENYDFTLLENKLYLYDEGKYFVEIVDEKTNINYSFEITIDTTPPTLELVNVENGGTTKKNVILKNVSEKPYTLNITCDGINFDYSIGKEIEKCGRFVVVLYDEAGNSTTYTFEKQYGLNGPSIAVIVGLGLLVILFIILLVKSRHHYYKEEQTEEEIEETIVDDENDDNGNEDTLN